MIIDHLYYVPESLYQGALAVANRTNHTQQICMMYRGERERRFLGRRNGVVMDADLRCGNKCRWEWSWDGSVQVRPGETLAKIIWVRAKEA